MSNKKMIYGKIAQGLASFIVIIVLLTSILATSIFYQATITPYVIYEDSFDKKPSSFSVQNANDINELSSLNEGWYSIRNGYVYYLENFDSYVPLYIKIRNPEQKDGLMVVDEDGNVEFDENFRASSGSIAADKEQANGNGVTGKAFAGKEDFVRTRIEIKLPWYKPNAYFEYKLPPGQWHHIQGGWGNAFSNAVEVKREDIFKFIKSQYPDAKSVEITKLQGYEIESGKIEFKPSELDRMDTEYGGRLPTNSKPPEAAQVQAPLPATTPPAPAPSSSKESAKTEWKEFNDLPTNYKTALGSAPIFGGGIAQGQIKSYREIASSPDELLVEFRDLTGQPMGYVRLKSDISGVSLIEEKKYNYAYIDVYASALPSELQKVAEVPPQERDFKYSQRQEVIDAINLAQELDKTQVQIKKVIDSTTRLQKEKDSRERGNLESQIGLELFNIRILIEEKKLTREQFEELVKILEKRKEYVKMLDQPQATARDILLLGGFNPNVEFATATDFNIDGKKFQIVTQDGQRVLTLNGQKVKPGSDEENEFNDYYDNVLQQVKPAAPTPAPTATSTSKEWAPMVVEVKRPYLPDDTYYWDNQDQRYYSIYDYNKKESPLTLEELTAKVRSSWFVSSVTFTDTRSQKTEFSQSDAAEKLKSMSDPYSIPKEIPSPAPSPPPPTPEETTLPEGTKHIETSEAGEEVIDNKPIKKLEIELPSKSYILYSDTDKQLYFVTTDGKAIPVIAMEIGNNKVMLTAKGADISEVIDRNQVPQGVNVIPLTTTLAPLQPSEIGAKEQEIQQLRSIIPTLEGPPKTVAQEELRRKLLSLPPTEEQKAYAAALGIDITRIVGPDGNPINVDNLIRWDVDTQIARVFQQKYGTIYPKLTDGTQTIEWRTDPETRVQTPYYAGTNNVAPLSVVDSLLNEGRQVSQPTREPSAPVTPKPEENVQAAFNAGTEGTGTQSKVFMLDDGRVVRELRTQFATFYFDAVSGYVLPPTEGDKTQKAIADGSARQITDRNELLALGIESSNPISTRATATGTSSPPVVVRINPSTGLYEAVDTDVETFAPGQILSQATPQGIKVTDTAQLSTKDYDQSKQTVQVCDAAGTCKTVTVQLMGKTGLISPTTATKDEIKPLKEVTPIITPQNTIILVGAKLIGDQAEVTIGGKAYTMPKELVDGVDWSKPFTSLQDLQLLKENGIRKITSDTTTSDTFRDAKGATTRIVEITRIKADGIEKGNKIETETAGNRITERYTDATSGVKIERVSESGQVKSVAVQNGDKRLEVSPDVFNQIAGTNSINNLNPEQRKLSALFFGEAANYLTKIDKIENAAGYVYAGDLNGKHVMALDDGRVIARDDVQVLSIINSKNGESTRVEGKATLNENRQLQPEVGTTLYVKQVASDGKTVLSDRVEQQTKDGKVIGEYKNKDEYSVYVKDNAGNILATYTIYNQVDQNSNSPTYGMVKVDGPGGTYYYDSGQTSFGSPFGLANLFGTGAGTLYLKDTDGKLVKVEDEKTNAEWEQVRQNLNKNSESKGQLKPEQASSQRFFANVERIFTEFQGLGYYSSLFFSEDSLLKWRDQVDRTFATLYLGTEYWSSAICGNYLDGENEGLAYAETPQGLAQVAAHIEAARSDPIIDQNGQQSFIYKITFRVRNGDHEKDLRAPEKMKINVILKGERTVSLFRQQQEVKRGSSFGRAGASAIVKESKSFYSQVCMHFDEVPSRWKIDGNEICNAIQSSSSSAGGSGGGGGGSGGGSGEFNEI